MTATEGLTFDEATHSYRLNGSLVPSVTQVIGSVLPGWQAGDWYLQRGRALHHGCRLMDGHCLDWNTVDEAIKPRLLAWGKFRDECPSATVLLCEEPLAHPGYRFAGTIDRVFGNGKSDIIADIKSTIEPQVRVQLGGYSLLWTEHTGRKAIKAVAVELRDDGTYGTLWIDAHGLRRAQQTFLAALTIFNFKTLHKIGESNGR